MIQLSSKGGGFSAARHPKSGVIGHIFKILSRYSLH